MSPYSPATIICKTYHSTPPFLHVIGHHSPARIDNLQRILSVANMWPTGCLQVVWNNSGAPLVPTEYDLKASVVDCPNNPVHGRYLASLIWPEFEYFLFQDDDLIIDCATAQRLVKAVVDNHGIFAAIEGRRVKLNSDRPYTEAHGIRASDNPGQPNDMAVRVYACHRTALSIGLNWILNRGIAPGRCETALFTLGRTILIKDTDWKNLPEGDEALCADPTHHLVIDTFINNYIKPILFVSEVAHGQSE